MNGERGGPQGEEVRVRDVRDEDLPTFFGQQLDAEANRMAAFTPEDPADREAFAARWEGILRTEDISKRTVLVDGRVAGHVMSFDQDGRREVTYWLGKAYWGRGIATAALRVFLRHEGERPIYARAAKDNAGSIGVLRKCGFEIRGEGRGFSNARGREVEEFVLVLEAGASPGP